MKEIQLTQDKVALVDDEDFEYLNQWKWYAINSKNTSYAVRSDRSSGRNKRVWMHRLVYKVRDDFDVDHKDMNGLNNQKCNLREACKSEQNRKKKRQKNNTSGYKGVSYFIHSKRYQARIQTNRKSVFLGEFSCPIEAAKAYDKAAIKYHGDFARLNFEDGEKHDQKR